MIPLMMAALLNRATVTGPVARCRPAQIHVSWDGRDGEFSGMSQNGAVLTVENVGTRACRVATRPRLRLFDRDGRDLAARPRPTPRGNTGRRDDTVTVAPHGHVAATLHWVAGPVYPHSRCVVAASVGVPIDGGLVRTAGGGQLCTPAGSPPRFDQPPLASTADGR